LIKIRSKNPLKNFFDYLFQWIPDEENVEPVKVENSKVTVNKFGLRLNI